MTTACRWPNGCTEPAGHRGFGRGYCRIHYLRLYRAGRIQPGFVDSSVIQASLSIYTERRRSLRTASALSGVNYSTLKHIACGRITRTRSRATVAILTAPLPPSDIGCMRRLQALLALGHSLETVATDMGHKRDTLVTAIWRQRFSDRCALALLATYERLSGSAGVARREDYPPPLAWEFVDIDDPAAVPDLGPDTRVTAADKVAEIEAQLLTGESLHMACKAVGIKPETLDSIRWRAAAREAAA